MPDVKKAMIHSKPTCKTISSGPQKIGGPLASSWFNNKTRSMGRACPIVRNYDFIK